MKTLTSNQRYGALNRRFDRRAALLRRFGFTYAYAEFPQYEGDKHPATIGIFKRTHHCRVQVIPAATVSEAPNDLWRARLANVLDRS